MPNDLPFIDGRINKPLSSYAAAGNRPVSEANPYSGSATMQYLEDRSAPRGPERTKLELGEIVLEVDVCQIAKYKRRWFDVFLKTWQNGDEEILSGNGPYVWSYGGREYLNSRFDMNRVGPGQPRDRIDLFRDVGPLPGHGITLDRVNHKGRIIDLFDLPEYESLWEHLRRRAVRLEEPVFIGFPAPPIDVVFKNEVDEVTWEYGMRMALDDVMDTADMHRHVVRDFQNARDLRTKEQLILTGKVRMSFMNDAQRFALRRDMEERAKLAAEGKLAGKPEDYAFNGFLTPTLAGMEEADLATQVISAREIAPINM